jgi:hypothetical protein
MLNTDIEYKGYLLRVHRIGTFGAYSCFAMKLREPGNLKPPYAGRIQAGEFKGKGAKRRAFDTIKGLVDEGTNKQQGDHDPASANAPTLLA